MPSLPTSWDLAPLLAGDTDPRISELEAVLRAKTAAFVAKWKDRTDYLEQAAVLREALDEYDAFQEEGGTSGTMGYYFSLRSAQDQESPIVQAGSNRVEELDTSLENDLSFFDLRLAAAGKDRLAAFAQDEALAPYRHYIERLAAYAPYLLSEEVEKALNMKAITSRGNWVKLSSKLLFGEEREVTSESGTLEKMGLEGLFNLMQGPTKAVRDGAADAINDILRSHLTVVEAEINSVLADKKTTDELRGFARPDLSRHLSDDIESAAVDGLVAAVESRFDIPRRFYALKARLLGLEKLGYHERNVTYGELKSDYSYDKAFELVRDTFQNLDPEFADILTMFAEKGQIDVFPAKGKRGGAFCACNSPKDPVYILLNHTGSLDDVLTLAHEAGHGINDELIRKSQSALAFGTPLSTAEVASTFMEDFVLDRLAAEATPEERLAILMMKLGGDMGTIFRQVACYRFEEELHREFRAKHYLDAPAIGEIFRKHMSAYMGDAVEQSEGSQNWWSYWSHIRTFFYVYSYASGLLISKSLQASVKEDPAFIGKVKEFLSAGTSASPEEIFQKLGIDITDTAFWNAGLSRVATLLDEAEDLALSLGKITPIS